MNIFSSFTEYVLDTEVKLSLVITKENSSIYRKNVFFLQDSFFFDTLILACRSHDTYNISLYSKLQTKPRFHDPTSWHLNSKDFMIFNPPPPLSHHLNCQSYELELPLSIIPSIFLSFPSLSFSTLTIPSLFVKAYMSIDMHYTIKKNSDFKYFC